jgi:hypothetical protein
MKKDENWPSFWPFNEKNLFLFLESFFALCLFHRRYLCHAMEGHVPSRPRGRRATSTYNCSDNLGYIWDLNGKQKQLIKKLVHICTINGKKTRSRVVEYFTKDLVFLIFITIVFKNKTSRVLLHEILLKF